jgi:hypothetical protein
MALFLDPNPLLAFSTSSVERELPDELLRLRSRLASADQITRNAGLPGRLCYYLLEVNI